MIIQSRYEYDPQKDLLGKGGFARVFRAKDIFLHRPVALKIFNATGQHGYTVLEEIRKVIQFDHPNLLRYYDVVMLEGTNNLGEAEKTEIGVMELANAGDLKEFARANLGSPVLYKLLKDVLLGLEYLHSKGIIHRDLKAQNILLLRQDGQLTAKISDFGISKDTGSGGQSSSMMVGTIEYMAPEQFAPAKYGIDGKVASNLDLWSFGIMVHELLTDSTPFGSRDGNTTAEQIMMQILSTELPHDIDKLPEPYKSVVKKCLVTNAKERIRRASELLSYFNETGSTAPQADNRQHTDDSTRVYPKGGPNARPDSQNNARGTAPSANVDPNATKVYPKGESKASYKAQSTHGQSPHKDQATTGNEDRPGSGKTATNKNKEKSKTALIVTMAVVVLVVGGGWWYSSEQQAKAQAQAQAAAEANAKAKKEEEVKAAAAAKAAEESNAKAEIEAKARAELEAKSKAEIAIKDRAKGATRLQAGDKFPSGNTLWTAHDAITTNSGALTVAALQCTRESGGDARIHASVEVSMPPSGVFLLGLKRHKQDIHHESDVNGFSQEYSCGPFERKSGPIWGLASVERCVNNRETPATGTVQVTARLKREQFIDPRDNRRFVIVSAAPEIVWQRGYAAQVHRTVVCRLD